MIQFSSELLKDVSITFHNATVDEKQVSENSFTRVVFHYILNVDGFESYAEVSCEPKCYAREEYDLDMWKPFTKKDKLFLADSPRVEIFSWDAFEGTITPEHYALLNFLLITDFYKRLDQELHNLKIDVRAK